MGCIGLSKHQPEQTIENTVKILCLGLGGCGKTTFVKQLKIINRVPWEEAEIHAFTKAIKSNLIKGMQDATDALKKLGLTVKPEVQPLVEQLQDVRGTAELTPEILQLLRELYEDPSIRTVIERHTELLTVTHLQYFWQHIDRILQPEFVPNDEDILRARVRTAGANFSTIYVDKRYYEFYDVGGQKPERAKWEAVLAENAFEAIIYFVASDEFDVDNEEDGDTKINISRNIFVELVSMCHSCPVVLFLNRMDLFTARLMDKEGLKSFQEVFKEYNGGQSHLKGLEFLKDWFFSAMDRKGSVKYHFTCAMDREGLVVVWRTVKEALMNRTIKDLGF